MSSHPTTRISTPHVSVVVPVLDDAARLAGVLGSLPAVHEVIVVDGVGGATVATVLMVRPDTVVVRRTRPGRGNALAVGLARVTGDVVVVLDPAAPACAHRVPRLVAALVAGADVARTPCVHGHRDRGALALWADLLPLLDLPDVASGRRAWGDGDEIDVLVRCRLAAAGARVVEAVVAEDLRHDAGAPRRGLTQQARVRRAETVERRRARNRPDDAAYLALARHLRRTAVTR